MEKENRQKHFWTFYLPPDPTDKEREDFLQELSDVFDDLTYTYRGILVTHSKDDLLMVRMPPDHEEDLE
mgnify:CR=1 FL=1